MLKDYQGMAKIGVWPPLLCIFDNCALKRRCCVWAHFGLFQWSHLPCKNITPDRGELPARPSCCPLRAAILPKGCLPCTSTPKNRGTSLQTPRWGSEKITGDQAVRVHFLHGVGVPSRAPIGVEEPDRAERRRQQRHCQLVFPFV